MSSHSFSVCPLLSSSLAIISSLTCDRDALRQWVWSRQLLIELSVCVCKPGQTNQKLDLAETAGEVWDV